MKIDHLEDKAANNKDTSDTRLGKEVIELREVSDPDDVSSIDQETTAERKFRRLIEGVRHLGAFAILFIIIIICGFVIFSDGENLNQLRQTALTLIVTIGGGAVTLLFNKKD